MSLAAQPRPLIDVDQMQNVVLESLSDGVYFVDRNRRILYWNKAAEHLTGYAADQVLGSSCADNILMHVDAQGNCLCENGCPLAAVMKDGQPREAHVFLHHREGHRVPVHVRGAAIYGPNGSVIGSVETFSDDTDRIRTLDRLRQMEQAALVDQLTGLANRRYAERALNASFAEYTREQTPFGIMLLDIDHFKRFNDTHGHEAGDRVLELVGRTLTSNCRAYDTPARWGGEEFAIVCTHINELLLATTADRLRSLIAASGLDWQGEQLQVTASVGATMVKPDDDSRSLLRRADELLYQSKAAGRNQVTC